MDPSYARKLLAYNKHTSDPDNHPNPFETQIELVRSGDYLRFPGFAQAIKSQVRATICAMANDTVSAALWALSGFDPALVHLAELRERFIHLNEEDPLRSTLDRLCSVYVEGQCRELLNGAGITTGEANHRVDQAIGDTRVTVDQILACTNDPLAMELFGYALWLGSLTAHGKAPWNRFAAVIADCYHQRQQSPVNA